MADFPFILFDTAIFGTAANTTHTLFTLAQGADSTHTKQFTNNRSGGQLPQNEKLLIQKVHATIWNTVAEADLFDWFDGCYLELFIADESYFRIPLVFASSRNDYSGVLAQAAAANNVVIGHKGYGWEVKPNITLMGGNSFKIEVFQQNALAAVDNMWIGLEGILTR